MIVPTARLTHTDSRVIYLPEVEALDRDAVADVLASMRDDGSVDAIFDGITEGAPIEAPTHAEALGSTPALLESLLDEDPEDLDDVMVGYILFICALPAIPESIAVQVAFGRRAGDDHYLGIVRLAARADQRGLTVDEYVAELRERDEIPRGRFMRLFRGESRRKPDVERLQRGIRMLRRIAALAPDRYLPPVFSALGWMYWALGKRAIALNHLAAALTIDPVNILARGLGAHLSSRQPAWLEESRGA